MSITLSYQSTTVDLPDDLLWTDQHSWSPIVQNVTTSISGAALVDVGAKIAQRPITLAGDEGHAWIPYATVAQLKTWAAIAGCQMTLNIRGTNYSVLFRHHDAPAVDLAPIVDYAAPDNQDWFAGQLKFMEV